MVRSRRPGQAPEPKQADGSWKIWYRVDQAQSDGSIRRIQRTKVLGRVSDMTVSQARAEAKRFIQPINDLTIGLEFTQHTFAALVERWRQTTARTLRPETLRSYSWALKRITSRFADVPVSEIERSDVEAFLIDCRAEGLSSSAVDTIKRRLKALFARAVEWEWLAVSPVRGRFRLGTAVKARPKTILSRPQIEGLLRLLPAPYSTLVLLAVYAGLRKAELAGLQWDDVRSGYVLIRRSVVRGVEGPTKTPGSEASVPLGPQTQRALHAWRSAAKYTGPRDWVFANRSGKPRNLDMVATKILKPAGRSLGIEPLSWHDLRHTFVTLGRAAGVAPEVMQRLARHSDVSTTLEIYSHVTDSKASRLIEGVSLLPEVTGNQEEVLSIQ
jgi:integrase